MAEPESPVRGEWMALETAMDAYAAFEADFGPGHALLACHAAFPLVLSPELVNLIQINFLDREQIPWIAGPDFLLSPLCRPIGGGFYQVDPNAREVLLVDLVNRVPDSARRLWRLADFLLAYVERPSWSKMSRPQILRAYRWIAWSYLDPGRTVADLTEALESTVEAADVGSRLLARADQQQITAMLEVVRAPLEFSLPPETYRNLMETADFLVSYWYPGRVAPTAPGAEPGERPNPLRDKVAEGVRRAAAAPPAVEEAEKAAEIPTPKPAEAGQAEEAWSLFGDLEIRIGEREPAGYPVEMTLDGELLFRRGYLDSGLLPWKPGDSSAADGERLFRQLLPDEQFQAAWARARALHPYRRIRLRVDPPTAELQGLPWELLREPGDGGPAEYVAASSATPFFRYIAMEAPASPPATARPIKILVAIANPTDSRYGLPPLDVEAEWAAVQAATSGLDVELTLLPGPLTPTALARELSKGYHILHLVGFSAFNTSSGRGVFFLADEQNQAQGVDGAELASMLAAPSPGLRLVFLTAPQGPPGTAAHQVLAPRFVAAGVPVVLVMQDLLPVTTAQQFLATFYRRLLAHGIADLAANEARAVLLPLLLSGGAMPPLYSRLRENRLFGLPEVRAEDAAERQRQALNQALEQAKGGNLELAVEAVRAMEDLNQRAAALTEIVVTLIDAGKAQDAVNLVRATEKARALPDPVDRARLFIRLGAELGRQDEARWVGQSLKQAEAITAQVESPAARAGLLGELGRAYADIGEPGQAITYYEQALSIYRELADMPGQAMVLNNLGGAHDLSGDKHRALEYYQQALPIRREAGDRAGEAATLNNIGAVYFDLGDYEQALETLQQALAIRREIGDRAGEATTLDNLSGIYVARGDRQTALETLQQALALARAAGDRAGEAAILLNTGRVYSDMADWQQAENSYAQALAIRREIGDRAGEGVALNAMGLLYDVQGQPQEARHYYQQAIELAQRAGDRWGERAAHANLAAALTALGDLDGAEKEAHAVVALDEQLGHPGLEQDRQMLAGLQARREQSSGEADAVA